ncbi:nucleoside deaminase [Aquirhabdus sp.]|uniref:nucleoside deaminase n=1 Tax=Aquirhabdus sp. TaxID=2824160 RepID=UPI00396C4F5C
MNTEIEAAINTSAPTETLSLSTRDQDFLRQSIALSQQSREQGKHPFAAIVVNPDGKIIAQAGNNSLPPEGDPTRHAEIVAVGMAAKILTPHEMQGCTLYTNAEPCAMCAGGIYWGGIGRVVYGISEVHLLEITGNHPENPTLSLPCRQVFASGQRPTTVIGPCLVEEAAAVHEGFWQ